MVTDDAIDRGVALHRKGRDQMITPEPLIVLMIASVMVKFLLFLAVMGIALGIAWLLSREV